MKKRLYKICLAFLLITLSTTSLYAQFSISSPPSNSYYNIGASFNLTLSGVPPTTAKVVYYIDAINSSTVNSAPFSVTVGVSPSDGGSHNFTAKAYNSGGTLLATTAAIIVNVYPPAPSVAANSRCGAGTLTVTESGSPSGGTFNWYNTSSGGTAVLNTTSNTTPNTLVTTTYYVSYSVGGVESTSRTAVTLTINPIVSSPLSGTIFSYPFNANANDVSGNNDNGTLQNSPTLTTDRFGAANSAYSFNGTNQHVTTTTQFVNPTVFSISMWFKTTTTFGGKLIGFGDSQTGTSYTYDRHIYMDNAGKINFGIYNGVVNVITSPNAYNDGVWHRVVVTIGATNGSKLYMDGVLVASNSAMNTPQNFTGYWRIGWDNLNGWTNSPSSYYFSGSIDDVGIYNRELSAAEVAGSNDLNMIGASATFCEANTITLNAPAIAGASYSWTDGTNTVTGNPATFSSAASSYTLTVTNSGCTSNATISPGSQTFTWTGNGASTNPLAANNWNNTTAGINNQAPVFNGTETLVIPTGLVVYPALTANQSIYSLKIAGTGTLTLNGFVLNVGCNIYNTNNTAGGILYGSNINSELVWNGSVASQNYFGQNTSVSASFGKMTVNNSNSTPGVVTISGGKVDIYNLLTITTGNLAVASSGTLTLKSSSTQTAAVAAIPSAYNVSGNVNVERFMTGSALHYRGYRLMSSSVNQGALFSGGPLGYGFNELKVNGFVTGYGGVTNGFDVSPQSNPSIRFYNEPESDPANQMIINSDYRGIADLGQKFPIGNGYLYFFRGSRSTVNPYLLSTVPVASTFTFIGFLNQGDVNVQIPTTAVISASAYASSQVYNTPTNASQLSSTLTGTNRGSNNDGLHLVGNPYASPIDLEAVTIVNPYNQYIYTFNNVGSGYISAYLRGSGTYTGGIYTAGASRYILPGQGFFVQAPRGSSTTTVKFTESSKAPMAAGSTVVFAVKHDNVQQLHINLFQDTTNSNETLITFAQPGAKNSYDGKEDAYYRYGITQNTFMSSYANGGYPCIINQMGALDSIKTIPLYAEGPVNGLYKLQFSGSSTIDPRFTLYLKDNLMADSLQLNDANTEYTFNIDHSNPKSSGASRFSLVVHNNPKGNFYRLVSFAGNKAGSGVALKWITQYEGDYTGFVVQRSTDGGKTFTAIGQAIQSDGSGTYNFTDPAPATGQNQYRLAISDINDKPSLSATVTIGYAIGAANGSQAFVVYPNPATANVSVKLNKPVIGKTLTLRIYSSSGALMSKATLDVNSALSQDVSRLMQGNYIMEVTDNGNNAKLGSVTFSKL